MRIDPTNEFGQIDINFFSSEEFMAERNIVEKYLKTEGFEQLFKEAKAKKEKLEIFISLNDRSWRIS